MPRTNEQTKGPIRAAADRLAGMAQAGADPGEQAGEYVAGLAEVDTTAPLETRDGQTPGVDLEVAELVAVQADFAPLPEVERRAALRVGDAQCIRRSVALLRQAARELNTSELPVGDDTIRRVLGEVAQWAAARGFNGHAGGGSG